MPVKQDGNTRHQQNGSYFEEGLVLRPQRRDVGERTPKEITANVALSCEWWPREGSLGWPILGQAHAARYSELGCDP
jgi:hypothetical protein